jgi:hypothetical protein
MGMDEPGLRGHGGREGDGEEEVKDERKDSELLGLLLSCLLSLWSASTVEDSKWDEGAVIGHKHEAVRTGSVTKEDAEQAMDERIIVSWRAEPLRGNHDAATRGTAANNSRLKPLDGQASAFYGSLSIKKNAIC